jgi:hypothetical protein
LEEQNKEIEVLKKGIQVISREKEEWRRKYYE